MQLRPHLFMKTKTLVRSNNDQFFKVLKFAVSSGITILYFSSSVLLFPVFFGALADMGRFKNYFERWANGSPPINDEVYRYIYDEFSLLFVLSCWFPDLRPKYRAFSIGFCTLYSICVLYYVFTFIISVYNQRSDLAALSLSANVLIIHFLTITLTALINVKRNSMICLFRAMFEDFFDYGDGEEIPEMREEIQKSRRQKMFVLIFQPIYLALTAITALSRPFIDSYFGIEEESYLNDVYMLVPVPCWYPFRITNDFLHYLTTWSQVITGSMNAAFFTAMTATQVIFMQGLGLQLKILRYRIRKLGGFAYKRHIEDGGKSLTPTETFQDPNFLKKFNKYLNLCAMHHINIITNFNHLQELFKWPLFVTVLTLSVMICVTLILFVVGGKQSAVALGSILFFDEVVNLGMMCWQTEQVIELAASLHEELYDINWEDLDLRAKRTMMIMIERTKQPLVLSAAVTRTPMNWETFSRVLNTAYSYVNLMSAAIQ